MNTVAIDFETYYDKRVSISVQGMVGYVEHPDFDPYMVSIVGTDAYGKRIAYAGHPDDAPWHRVDHIRWVSHNMAFDSYVWKYMVRKRGKHWGQGPEEWHCTADLSVYCQGPRALAAATRVMLPELSGHGKGMRSWAKGKTPDEIKALGMWDEMCEYALLDSAECLALWEKLSPFWPETERALSNRTAAWGHYGVQVDVKKLGEAIKDLEEQLLDAQALIPWSGEQAPTSQPALIRYCQQQGIPAPPSTAMDHPDCIAWEKKHGKKHRCLEGMRQYRRVNKMLALLKAIRNLTREDGTMPYSIKYFGAHTGRWSGGAERDNTDVPKSINMQNIYRGELFGWNVREMFTARPGHTLVICDLSQIEPRCLAYIAGQENFLELVGKGMSPYEAHARLTMGYTHADPLKKVDPGLYGLAKARVLALGYGAGPPKFQMMAANYGVDISLEEAKQTVNDFRKHNPEIVKFWKTLDVQFRAAARTREAFEVTLPSGREMLYLNPEFRKTKSGDHTRTQPVAQTVIGGPKYGFYGGKLCENIIQATARDVFASLMLNVAEWLDLHGGRVLWHVHDEVICEVPEDDAEFCKEVIEDLMSDAIPWMPGCPIAAEAEITNHYKK